MIEPNALAAPGRKGKIESVGDSKTSPVDWDCGFLMVIALISFLYSSCETASDLPGVASHPSKGTVNAKITFDRRSIRIRNNDSFRWPSLEVFINGNPPFAYRAKIPEIAPGQAMTFDLSEFVKDNGERFQPDKLAVRIIWIGGGDYDYMNYGAD